MFSRCTRSTASVLLSERTLRVPTVSMKVAVEVSILSPGALWGFHCDGIFFNRAINGVSMSWSVASLIAWSPPRETMVWRAEAAEWQTEGLVSKRRGPRTETQYCKYFTWANCSALHCYLLLNLHVMLHMNLHYSIWVLLKHCKPNIQKKVRKYL